MYRGRVTPDRKNRFSHVFRPTNFSTPAGRRRRSSYNASAIMRLLRRLRVSYLHLLGCCWLLLIWYGERTYPYHKIRDCDWPTIGTADTRIALIADPQIIDDNTYPGRNRVLLSVTKYIVDYYLRKNWVYINDALDPDVNVFLGDLFDGGREWKDKAWKEEFDRYNRIFTKPAFKRTIMSLPGNHDIGYGDTIVPHALNRFRAYFGETSSTVGVGNHTLVILDTISMLNTINESIYGPPKEFMDNLAKTAGDPETKPRILLSHVPLYRDKDASCGKYREAKKPLPYVKGYQYQTLVTPELSQKILSAVNPIAVFSGDDHDACHVQHPYKLNGQEKTTDEFTVKSISMAMGIEDPGIQLLTLGTSGAYETSICFMPSPFYPFLLYGLFLAVTLANLTLFNLYPKHLPSWLLVLQKQPRIEEQPNDALPMHYDREVKHFTDSTAKSWKPYRPPTFDRKSLLRDVLILSVIAVPFFIYLSRSIYYT